MPQQIRRKTAPNDVPTLLFVMVLVLVQWCFNSTSAVLGAALLGVVPVLCVVAFRQLPWTRLRGRWQWRSIMSSVLATAFIITILFRFGYWRWWLCAVLLIFFIIDLIGMQIHRWTSLLMAVFCAIMGWILL